MAIESSYDYFLDDSQLDNAWFKPKPYCFRIYLKEETLSFYLPINPSNLSISTHFATNVISTVYGTVEEHSEQRYFDIVISGTTGMMPQNYEYVEDGSGETVSKGDTKNAAMSTWDKIKQMAKQSVLGGSTAASTGGRDSFSVNKNIGGGFFGRTQALISNTINKAIDIFGDKSYKSGVIGEKSGYVAFHNLYRFLLAYKKDVLRANNGRRIKHPITFINYKDNNQYKVAIQTFQLTRSVDDPMLYKYNIVMRGYDLEQAGGKIEGFLADRNADLGLDGVDSVSLKAKLSNGARSAKNAVASAVAAVNGLGS